MPVHLKLHLAHGTPNVLIKFPHQKGMPDDLAEQTRPSLPIWASSKRLLRALGIAKRGGAPI
jgi:hypothetical protein